MILVLQVAFLLCWIITPTQSQSTGIGTTTPLPCEAPEGWIEAGKVDTSLGDEPVGGCTKRIVTAPVQRIGWRCEDRYCCSDSCSCNSTENLYTTAHDPLCSKVLGTLYCYVQYREMTYYQTVCCEGHIEDENRNCVEPFDCDKHSAQCEGFCTKKGNTSVCDCKFGLRLVNKTKCEDVNECTRNNGGCQQICENTDGSYNCACQPGWSLFQGSKCYDIDECSVGTAECSHGCINTPGGYNCTCPTGMHLSSDEQNCTGTLTTEVEVSTHPIINSDISSSGASTTEQPISITTPTTVGGAPAVFNPLPLTTSTPHTTTNKLTSMLLTTSSASDSITSTTTNIATTVSESPDNGTGTVVGVQPVQAGKKVPLLVLILAPLLAVLFLILLCCFLAFRYCRKEAEEPYNETVVAFDNMAYESATGVTIVHSEEDEIKKKEPEPPDVVYVEPECDKKKLDMMGEYDEVMEKPPPYQETDPMDGAWARPPPASREPRYVKTSHQHHEDEEGFYEEIPEKSHYANMSEGVSNDYVLSDQTHYVNVQRPSNPWTGQLVSPVTEAEEQNQINDMVQDM